MFYDLDSKLFMCSTLGKRNRFESSNGLDVVRGLNLNFGGKNRARLFKSVDMNPICNGCVDGEYNLGFRCPSRGCEHFHILSLCDGYTRDSEKHSDNKGGE
jgi:hypothetical protein